MAQGILRLLLVAVLLAGGFSLMGCETWEGLGRDVERTGEKMQ
jgi:predicted small secreted protein